MTNDELEHAVRGAIADVFDGARVDLMTEPEHFDDRCWVVRVHVGEKQYCLAGEFAETDNSTPDQLIGSAVYAAERLKAKLRAAK